MELKEKVVMITGSAKRIGRAIALSFAEKGSKVLIHYNQSGENAENLVQEILNKGGKAYSYQADLTDLFSLKKMTELVLRDHGTVDILINNASKFFTTTLETTEESHWDELMAIHVKAPFFLAQQLGPSMKKKGKGRIINIADWRGLRPRKNFMVYCTSKAALLSLTKSLAKELAPEVLVTAVCPGPILPADGTQKEEQERIAKKTLLKRWGSPQDVVKQVLFLAEQEYATGEYFFVDGGESLL